MFSLKSCIFYSRRYGLFWINFCIMCKFPVFSSLMQSFPLHLISYSLYCYSFYVAPFVKKATLPFELILHFCQKSVRYSCMGLFPGSLFFPLMSVTIPSPIPYSLDYRKYTITWNEVHWFILFYSAFMRVFYLFLFLWIYKYILV